MSIIKTILACLSIFYISITMAGPGDDDAGSLEKHSKAVPLQQIDGDTQACLSAGDIIERQGAFYGLISKDDIQSQLPSGFRLLTWLTADLTPQLRTQILMENNITLAEYTIASNALGYAGGAFLVLCGKDRQALDATQKSLSAQRRESKTFEGWTNALSSILTPAKRTALTPSALYNFRDNRRDSFPDAPILIGGPAHDLPDDAPEDQKANSSGQTIHESLAEAIQGQDMRVKKGIWIPIAQNRDYCLGTRYHWTSLFLEMRDGKVFQINHLDSKGPSSRLYDLTHIEAAARGAIKNLNLLGDGTTPFNAYYFGHQGLINLRDCGHFQQEYAVMLCNDQTIQQIADEPAADIMKRL